MLRGRKRRLVVDESFELSEGFNLNSQLDPCVDEKLKPAVLVIEDDPDISELLSYRLRSKGFRVRTATTAVAGLEEAADDPPALITLDIGLPGINGWEVARRMRENPLTAELPIIVVSAYEVPADHPHIDGYIPKPFRLKQIDEAVERLIVTSV